MKFSSNNSEILNLLLLNKELCLSEVFIIGLIKTYKLPI